MSNEAFKPYDSHDAVRHYEHTYSTFWDEFPKDLSNEFVKLAMKTSRSKGLVLCVGSGLGEEAVLLNSYGLNPICLDGAAEMVKASQGKGADSIQGSFLNLPVGNNQFDGVWAYKSLCHAANFEELEAALFEVRRALKPRGALSWCMLGGRKDEVKDSYFDGTSTRRNLFLRENTFLELLESYNFDTQKFYKIDKGNTKYQVANAIKLGD